MLFSSLMLIYTGIFLFIAPPGRIAHWALWTLGGLSKEQYGNLHLVFILVFIISFVLHIYYNFKPIMQYLKNKAKKFVFFTPETTLALAICVLVAIGGLAGQGPLHSFLEWGEDISASWAEKYGKPPYGHAELSTLAVFTKKMKFDPKDSLRTLEAEGIIVDGLDSTLAKISADNKTSPQKLYKILKKAHKNQGEGGSKSSFNP